MTFSTLRALHATIGAAIDQIERIYHQNSSAHSLNYPSLDEPYYATASHTPDEDLAENLKSDPLVALASKRIVAACGQLSTTVNKPWFGLMEDIQAGQFSACIGFLEASNIVEILREAGPDGMDVWDIHRSVIDLRTNLKTAAPRDTEGLNPSNLSHILRLLATSHYLREVKPNVFANNRASSFIDSGKSVMELRNAPDQKYVDTDGVAAFVGVIGDETFKFMAWFNEWALPETSGPAHPGHIYGNDMGSKTFTDGKTESGLVHYATPFNLAFDTQLGAFEWWELPENSRRLDRFGHAMTGTSHWETKNEILQGFLWEELPKGSVLVDVGGGIGSQSIIVAAAHPHLRVVVEDRPQVVATAKSAWGTQHTHLFDTGRVSWRAHDFFEPREVPTPPDVNSVGYPSVFLLRLVLHDWQDNECHKILRRLREAAGPDTKLVIGDMLLPYACAHEDEETNGGINGTAAANDGTTTSFVPSDSPLLPNLGKANMHGYLIDILMMGMFGAKERTVGEMSALALSAGWKITEVRRTPGSLWAYTIAVPV